MGYKMQINNTVHRSLTHAQAILRRTKELTLTQYLDDAGIVRGIVRMGDHMVWADSHVLTASEIYRACIGKVY